MTFANSSLVADKSQPTDGRNDRATTRFAHAVLHWLDEMNL